MTSITIDIQKLANGKFDITSRILSDEGITAKEIAGLGVTGILNAPTKAHDNQLCNCIRHALDSAVKDYYANPTNLHTGQHN